MRKPAMAASADPIRWGVANPIDVRDQLRGQDDDEAEQHPRGHEQPHRVLEVLLEDVAGVGALRLHRSDRRISALKAAWMVPT